MLNNAFFRLALCLCLVLALQSCTTTQTKPANNAITQAKYAQHLQKIVQIQQFKLTGRIGVQADGKGFSGGLAWQHQPSNDDISLTSPLGGQVAMIEKTADKVTLTDSTGKSVSAIDAESLTQQMLGWKLPLTGLTNWALGRPSKNAIDTIALYENGQIQSLSQDGWRIEYSNYKLQDGYEVPTKISIRSEKILVKLLIQQWRIITY
ncbi:MAG: lipoprotein insertase outer membrane protein LolB [Methylophilaceae bacterium]